MKTLALLIITCMAMLPQLVSAQLIDLNGRWRFTIGDQRSWSAKDFDDSGWEWIKVPAAWENKGYHGYDGFAWYRTYFDGRVLKKGEKLFLNLGYIDDADEVYLNGELIGFSGSMPPNYKTAYNAERNYVIPNALIDYNGFNTLAVRVFDATHSGGITDGRLGIYKVDTRSPILIDLQGVWDFKVSELCGKPLHSEMWDKILVPGTWEKQGFWKYDGYAWYRREFEIDAATIEEDLVLVLGKIDDFDEVYINGKLAGRTNDHRPFGASQSYAKLRAYYLPGVLLKPGANTIEILVEDIGRDGGIYEGPLGITTRDLFNRHFKK